MRKVLFIDPVHPLLREELRGMGFHCEDFSGKERDVLETIAEEYEGFIIRSRFRIDRTLLDKCTKLRFIARSGSGMEGIDIEYAAQKGIACINSPEGNRDAVGEHTLGLLLSLLNHISRADMEIRFGRWIREGNRGTEIKGKTVGIIGYGNMGSAFAQRLKGFDANVISFDKYKSDYSDGNTREVSLETLFDDADIVSLHVPLNDETRYMADDAFLKRFRKDIFLVNTSRGPVVKTEDLVKNLESGHVRGAALDVLEYEDASFEMLKGEMPAPLQYLLGSGRVVMTPHIAGWTAESNIGLVSILLEKIKALYSGESLSARPPDRPSAIY
jgi:D-3-phosphoglycerate dehydrogenase / 2-oxoglutarate reductase